MLKHKFLAGVGLTLVAAGLALLPVTTSAEKPATERLSKEPCEALAANCEELFAREDLAPELDAEFEQMRAELDRAKAVLELEKEAMREGAWAELDAEEEKIQAEVGKEMAVLAAQGDVLKNLDEEEGKVLGDRRFFYFNNLGEDEAGWLGMDIREVTPEKVKELKLPAERGVLVTDVEPDSPAAQAGFKANDVVQEFSGQRIEGTAQFRRLVRETPAGRNAQIVVWRDGRAQSLSARLGSRRAHMESKFEVPAPPPFNFVMPELARGFGFGPAWPRMGIHIEDLSGQLGQYFGAPEGEGVLVRQVDPGSPAEKAGLKAGDVIIKLDGERVRSAHDLLSKMREKREQKTASVGILRKGAEISLNVEIEQPQPPRPMHLTRRIVL